MKIRKDVSLGEITSFQTIGVAPRLITVHSLSALNQFLQRSAKFRIIGKGSNTVISPDIDYDLLKIHSRFDPTLLYSKPLQPTTLIVSAGTTVPELMKLLIKRCLSGLEFVAGVPASVGGMVAMNFGCWGNEISQFLESIYVISRPFKPEILSNKQLQFSYRNSIFLNNSDSEYPIILGARFNLNPASKDDIQTNIKSAIQRRQTSQPYQVRTFGSVFKNPPGYAAGKLIEGLGLKNYQIGDVKISDKHANFFVNCGNATFSDITALILDVQRRVKRHYGITLTPEVQYFD
jgi:UDP-N-acetylmuramate dehydrogenase